MKKILFVLVSVLSAATLQAREQANLFTCEGDGVEFTYSASSFEGSPHIQATIENEKFSAVKRGEVKSQATVLGQVVYMTDIKKAVVDGPTYHIGMVVPFHQLGDKFGVELKTVVFKSAVAMFVPNIPLQLQSTDFIPVTCKAQKVNF